MVKTYKISEQSLDIIKNEMIDLSEQITYAINFIILNSINSIKKTTKILEMESEEPIEVTKCWNENELNKLKSWRAKERQNAKKEIFDIFDFIYELRTFSFKSNTNYIIDFKNKKILTTKINDNQIKPKIQNMAYRYSVASDYYSKTLEVNIPKLFIEENKQDEIER